MQWRVTDDDRSGAATDPTVSTSATEGSTDAWPTAIIERPLTRNAHDRGRPEVAYDVAL